jgi:hypothetical protein
MVTTEVGPTFQVRRQTPEVEKFPAAGTAGFYMKRCERNLRCVLSSNNVFRTGRTFII